MPPSISQLRERRLPLRFFQRPSPVVARALLGTVLVHGPRAGTIVETEAYLGPEDAASHARFGPTARTSVMFGPGGVTYVYLCYGIHEMFNIVTGVEGAPGAVLIRAIAPLLGLGEDPKIGTGPGKVTKALGLSRKHDRRPLDDDTLFVARGTRPRRIDATPRIGVDYAGRWAAEELRFTIAGHPSVCRR